MQTEFSELIDRIINNYIWKKTRDVEDRKYLVKANISILLNNKDDMNLIDMNILRTNVRWANMVERWASSYNEDLSLEEQEFKREELLEKYNSLVNHVIKNTPNKDFTKLINPDVQQQVIRKITRANQSPRIEEEKEHSPVRGSPRRSPANGSPRRSPANGSPRRSPANGSPRRRYLTPENRMEIASPDNGNSALPYIPEERLEIARHFYQMDIVKGVEHTWRRLRYSLSRGHKQAFEDSKNDFINKIYRLSMFTEIEAALYDI